MPRTLNLRFVRSRVILLVIVISFTPGVSIVDADEHRIGQDHHSGIPSIPASGGVVVDSLALLLREATPFQLYSRCDTLLSDPRGGNENWPRKGCFLHVNDTTDREVELTDRLWNWFETRGWMQVLTCSADGPDGTLFGVARDTTFRIVVGRWDGGDDADSTYIPRPGSEVTVTCVRPPNRAEPRILALAHGYERATRWHRSRPAL